MTDNKDAKPLLDTINKEVEKEKKAIEQKLDIELKEIQKETESEIQKLRDMAFRELDLEMSRYLKYKQSETCLKIRAKRLSIKQSVINRAFEETAKVLESEAGSARYTRSIEKLSEQAVNSFKDAQPLTENTNPDKKDKAYPQGTIIVENGSRLVDNSISTRLKRAKQHLLPQLSGILFKGE